MILTATHLSKIYGTTLNLTKALQNVSLNVGTGEFLGIMGPSGAGKSTLLNILSTLDQPTSAKSGLAIKISVNCEASNWPVFAAKSWDLSSKILTY
ncbi:ABC transporter ATP-binding protein [Agrilactobacillus composti DSM 18527 = JCM 14202]|nr:ABC transporter ATP-binding protein [Agrilactobacillus composti DSM 18527 = JCM 14202]